MHLRKDVYIFSRRHTSRRGSECASFADRVVLRARRAGVVTKDAN